MKDEHGNGAASRRNVPWTKYWGGWQRGRFDVLVVSLSYGVNFPFWPGVLRAIKRKLPFWQFRTHLSTADLLFADVLFAFHVLNSQRCRKLLVPSRRPLSVSSFCSPYLCSWFAFIASCSWRVNFSWACPDSFSESDLYFQHVEFCVVKALNGSTSVSWQTKQQ